MTKGTDIFAFGTKFFNPSGSLSGSKVSRGDFAHAAICGLVSRNVPSTNRYPVGNGRRKSASLDQTWQDSALFEYLV